MQQPGDTDPTGCLWTVVAAAVAVIAIGVLVVVHMVRDVADVSEHVDRLVAELGPIAAYTPPADGTIPRDRVEAYLAVREELMPELDELARELEALGRATERDGNPFEDVPEAMRAGMGILPRLADFARARADALLAHRVGSGEYLYLYVVTSYGWLGGSPADGPPFRMFGDGPDDRHEEAFEVRQARSERVIEWTRSWILPMVARQLEAAKASGLAGDDPWRVNLESELAALHADQWRLPWPDGLPEPLARSLAPYRSRLEASYRPLCNPVEIEGVRPRRE